MALRTVREWSAGNFDHLDRSAVGVHHDRPGAPVEVSWFLGHLGAQFVAPPRVTFVNDDTVRPTKSPPLRRPVSGRASLSFEDRKVDAAHIGRVMTVTVTVVLDLERGTPMAR